MEVIKQKSFDLHHCWMD